MSNPAVIVLSKYRGKNSFIIEDNIGESIHLHYNSLRVDLTTEEFLKLEATIKHCLQELIEIENFDITYFDPAFLKSIAVFLPDIERISVEDIEIDKLIIQRKGMFGLPILSPIYKSRVLKALKGDPKENNQYIQANLFNKTNQERVDDVSQLVKELGYPYNNKYIILFNNQNVIRDGQHRASALIFNGHKGSIPIIRLYFKNGKYNIPKKPWINVFKSKVLSLIRKIARKVYEILK